MFRILFYLLVVFCLGLGFTWLADRPGDVVVTFAGYRYEVSLMLAAVCIVAAIAAVMFVWWIIRSIWNTPDRVGRFFRHRRRDRGYQALSTGMIAAGAGDGGAARRMGRQAAKLIDADREPMLHMLQAQAALLEGDRDAARETFEAMLDDPEMKLLGLRGLYLEAERQGDHEAARHYADRAAADAPQLGWAADATLEARTEEGDWDGALKLLEAQRATRQVEREAASRRRAVLLTAKAMSTADTDPSNARAAAQEAVRLQPDFVPAAIIAARTYFANNDLRRGAKVLETIWKTEPHPEVADAYVNARNGDSALDRLARAQKLRSLKPNNVESSMAIARASLDAGEFAKARSAIEASLRSDPRESAYLLLADIEEAETGDQGRVRQWLSKAVRAPRDPAWVADGYVSEHWAPASPITGRLDAFEWRVPMQRLGQIVEGDEDVSAGRPSGAVAAIEAHRGDEDVVEDAEIADTLDATGETKQPAGAVAENPIPEQPAYPASPDGETVSRELTDADDRYEATAKSFGPEGLDDEDGESNERAGSPRALDDPGVDPQETDEEAPRRFRLF